MPEERDHAEWERRVADLWNRFDRLRPETFLTLVTELAADGPRADGLFELASAHDSLGQEQRAVELYREALAEGLADDRRRQAVIQLASSLRNVGQADEGAVLLQAELERGSDELDAALRAFLALCLLDADRPAAAVATAVEAVIPTLPRYQRSLTAYAAALRQR